MEEGRPKKYKYKSFRWDTHEEQIVISLFNENKPFEEISIAVNNYLNSLCPPYDCVPVRSPIAVAYRCQYLGLITTERSENYVKEFKNKLRKDRKQGLYLAKKKAFERDGNKCVVCSSDQQLNYCHLIPFDDTRKNEELNAITLCKDHHKEFDHHKKDVVRIVYHKMCSYYPHFYTKFVLIDSGKRSRIETKCQGDSDDALSNQELSKVTPELSKNKRRKGVNLCLKVL